MTRRGRFGRRKYFWLITLTWRNEYGAQVTASLSAVTRFSKGATRQDAFEAVRQLVQDEQDVPADAVVLYFSLRSNALGAS